MRKQNYYRDFKVHIGLKLRLMVEAIHINLYTVCEATLTLNFKL